jgi:hypothetical protein
MGDTPERERSVPMENVEEVKKKSKGRLKEVDITQGA